MKSNVNQKWRREKLLLLGLLLVVLLVTLTACQTKYVPVYLDPVGDWVLREDACFALQGNVITVDQYIDNKDLRDHVFREDAKWASFCIENARVQ